VRDHSSSILLEEFERVDAVPGTALLWILAHPSSGFAEPETVVLVIEDPSGEQRFAPLPAPSGHSGMFRTAFSAPVDLLNRSLAYRLELPDGSTVDLPAPSPQVARAAPARLEAEQAGRRPGTEPEESKAGHKPEESKTGHEPADETAAALREELVRRNADALEVARQFEQEAAARHESEQVIGRLQTDRRQLQARAEELEARLADALQAATRAATLERKLSSAREEVAALKAALAERVGTASAAAAAPAASDQLGARSAGLPTQVVLAALVVVVGIALAVLILSGSL